MDLLKPPSDTKCLSGHRKSLFANAERKEVISRSAVIFSEMRFCYTPNPADLSVLSFWHVCATWLWQKFSRSHDKIFLECEDTFICYPQWRCFSVLSPVDGNTICVPKRWILFWNRRRRTKLKTKQSQKVVGFFRAKKILSTPSFGGGSKAVCPMS